MKHLKSAGGAKAAVSKMEVPPVLCFVASLMNWIDSLVSGEPWYERRVVEQYTADLLDLARRKLPAGMRRRVDPEDVVQSVYRSFFRRVRSGEFAFDDSHDVWRLLAVMTYHKVYNVTKHHRRQRRDVFRDVSYQADGEAEASAEPQLAPQPDDMAVMLEYLERLLAELPERHHRLVVMRLEGPRHRRHCLRVERVAANGAARDGAGPRPGAPTDGRGAVSKVTHNPLSPAEWRSADELLMRFEEEWRSGGAAIVAFLPEQDSPIRRYVLGELIKLDLEYRIAGGQPARVESYLSDFPELEGDELVVELAVAELESRCCHGDRPTADEIGSRFPRERQRLQHYAQLPPTIDVADLQIAHYEVGEEVGRGSFSTVYRAWDPRLERDVAIKLARHETTGAADLRQRMVREARSAAKLQHPTIVPVHEVGEYDGRVFIVSDIVDGPTLEAHVRSTLPPPDQAARWAAQLADALEYAHQCGIVHRDVKPANVMLRDGEPVLMDFGLAHQSDSATMLTHHGDILGTPAFMSPEQASGSTPDVDRRSDVYSLGVVLYQMLCGRLPFEGAASSVIHRVLHDEPPLPRAIQNTIPPDLETICLKAMAKEPVRRYPSAAAMAEDLRRYLRHQPILARPVGPLGRFRLWCRRKPALAATIAASALLILAVAGFSYWKVLDERNRFRKQRNEAQANLYRSLLSGARSKLQARDTGWWFQALADVEAARRLEVKDRDPVVLRDLAVKVMTNDAPCFQLLQEWKGNGDQVAHLSVIPPGRFAAVADGSTLRFHDIKTGDVVATYRASAGIAALAVHPSGRWMLLADRQGRVQRGDLTELPTKQGAGRSAVSFRTLPRSSGVVHALQFSPDGRSVALATADGNLRIAAVNDGTPQWPGAELAGHKGPVLSVGWSLEGRLLASGGQDRTIRLWNSETRKQIQSWTSYDPVRRVRFRADNAAIGFVDRESFGYREVDLHKNTINDYALLHTHSVHQILGTRFGWLTASGDGTLRVFSEGISRAVARGDYAGVTTATVTGDGLVLAGYRDGTIRKWQLTTSPFVRQVALGHRTRFLNRDRRLAFDRGLIDLTHGFPGTTRELNVAKFSAIAALRADNHYACGTVAGELQLFQKGQTKPETTRAAHTGRMTALVAGPENRWLLSASRDGVIRQWDSRSLKPLREWKPAIGPVHSLAISGDGRRFVAGGRDGVGLWSVDGDQPVWKQSHHVQQATVVFGEGFVAFGQSDGTIRVLSIPEKGTSKTRPRFHLNGHKGEVTAMAILPDGRLVSAGRDLTVRLWNLRTGREAAQLRGLKANANNIRCHPEGRLIAVIGNTWIGFWQLPDPEMGTFAAIGGNLRADFSRDGKRLIVASDFGFTVDVPIERITAALHVKKFFTVNDCVRVAGGHSQKVWGLDVSRDDRWIATAGHDRTAKLWDMRTRQLRHTLTGHRNLIWCAAFSHDSRHLATGSSTVAGERGTGDIRIWDVAAGREVRRLTGHSGLVRSLAFDPRNRLLISGSSDGSVIVWNAATGKKLGLLKQFRHPVHDLAFSRDGRFLAAACDAEKVAVWDTADWQPWLAGAGDKTRRRSAPAPRVLADQTGHAWAVTFSRDGRFLAAGTGRDEVTLWRLSDFSRVVTLQSTGGDIRSLSFSKDDAFLAAGSYAGLGRIWDLAAIRRRLKRMRLNW